MIQAVAIKSKMCQSPVKQASALSPVASKSAAPIPEENKSSPRFVIGEMIRACRLKRQWSQEQLAGRAGLSRVTINLLESGKHSHVSLDTLTLIAHGLEISLRELICESELLCRTAVRRASSKKVCFQVRHPDYGLELFSYTPKQHKLFIGGFSLEAGKEAPYEILPHSEVIFLEISKGILRIGFKQEQIILRESEALSFCGAMEYEIYNPHPACPAVGRITACPAF